MQRDDLPKKAKFLSTIFSEANPLPTPKKVRCNNAFTEVQYRKKAWLYGMFGNKDGCMDSHYLNLKSEITAFSSACYRLYVNLQQPKYRSVYESAAESENKKHYTSASFITRKVANSISLKQLFATFSCIKSKELFSYVSPWFTYTDGADFFKKQHEMIRRWEGVVFEKYKRANLQQLEALVPADYLKVLEQCFIECVNALKIELSTYIEEQESLYLTQGIFKRDEICDTLINKHQEFSTTVFNEKILPIKNKMIADCRAHMLNHGLAEVMATAYALGEWSFKPRDLLIDGDAHQLVKIDHERCLWEITHQLLVNLNMNEIFNHPAEVLDQQSVAVSDIEEFPKRTHKPYSWPNVVKETTKDYPEWFVALLREDIFKQRAYKVFTAFVVTPSQILQNFAENYFSAPQRADILAHVVRRQQCLKRAMLQSASYLKYLSNLDNQVILNRLQDNGMPVEALAQTNQYLNILKLQQSKVLDNIDSQINGIYTIKPPHLKF